MQLTFDNVGSGPNLIILHGLFGSASNFRTLAKQFGEFYTVHCLDIRNHGSSPHDDDVSLAAMARDITDFMDDHGLDKSHLLGHSMGGKIAMQVAMTTPQRISKLIIGDIAPVTYPHHHDKIFQGMNEVTRLSPTSRKEAHDILAGYVEIPEVRQFLLTNLKRTDDNCYVWRLNVTGLEAGYEHLMKKPTGLPFQGPSLFIRGMLSDYVGENTFPAIYEMFPQAEIISMTNTGHWLHAEKPVEFRDHVLNFLTRD